MMLPRLVPEWRVYVHKNHYVNQEKHVFQCEAHLRARI